MVSFVMFFGCRVSGEKNDFKSYHNGIYAVIIAERRRPWQEAQGQNARLRHCSPPAEGEGGLGSGGTAQRGGIRRSSGPSPSLRDTSPRPGERQARYRDTFPRAERGKRALC